MIQKNTILRPTDSSGVYKVRVFHLYKGFNRKASFSGDFVKISALQVRPENILKKKSKHVAIIVRTKYKNFRKDGSLIKFFSNRLILLKKRLTPRAKTLKGVVSRNIRRKKFLLSFPKSL